MGKLGRNGSKENETQDTMHYAKHNALSNNDNQIMIMTLMTLILQRDPYLNYSFHNKPESSAENTNLFNKFEACSWYT